MKNWISFVFCLAVLISGSTSAKAGNLGVANDYNEFIFENSTRAGDSEGGVAVGQTATFNNFTIGSSLSGNSFNSLVVGGQLGGSQTNIQHGNAVYNSLSSPAPNIYMNGGGSKTGGADSSSFFSDAKTYLTNLSETLKNEAVNGKTEEFNYGKYQTFLTTQGDSKLQVFSINGDHLASTSYFKITSTVADATIVINVSGSTISMSNFSFDLSGTDQTHILFNFYDATSISLSGIDVTGSILAVGADVSTGYGQINGNLIAKSLSGTIETHNHLFAGNLPTPSAVPEPSSMGLMAAAGLMSLLPMIRRHRARKLQSKA